MEKYVKELFTEEVLEITSKLYGIERERFIYRWWI